MAEIWVISDTHFGHEGILRFTMKDGTKVRSFSDVYEMDEIMIRNWNALIKPGEKVYHLCHVWFGGNETAERVLPRLNGKKRLILGNHDNGKNQLLQKYFEKIDVW